MPNYEKNVPFLLEPFAHHNVIFLDGDDGSFGPEQETALATFVEQGGGVIFSGNAARHYQNSPVLQKMLGLWHGIRTPLTEIIVRQASTDHYLTRRTDPSFPVLESVYLPEELAPDVDIHWNTSWHYKTYPLVYTREYGHGRIFCTVLGTTSEAREEPAIKQMFERAIQYVKHEDRPEKPVRVAMLGYGAIGLEHGTAIHNIDGFEFSLVCDRSEARLKQARQTFPDIETCRDIAQIADNPDLDLVIISTPPNTHADLAMQMLRAGKHVVVEKPFCLTSVEADAMIELARSQQRVLTVYQCRRWDPDFLAIRQVVKEKQIGDVFHIETFIGGYAHPCDYWHSHEPISGGVFYDWGSHYLDWILQLIPDRVVSVSGVEHKRVWHDVTNADQSSVRLRFAQGQEAEFLHSDIAAALKPKWYILGEKGAIVGKWRQESIKTRRWSGDLVEEQLAPSEALPQLQIFTRTRDGAVHEQLLTLPPAPVYPFHRNLANHFHSGEALAVSPEEARRNIAVMEAASYSAHHAGQMVMLDC